VGVREGGQLGVRDLTGARRPREPRLRSPPAPVAPPVPPGCRRPAPRSRTAAALNAPATAVFVHGGWHDGWSWHLVRALLDARGVPSVALDLPMTTLDADAAVLSDALARVGEHGAGDTVVVAHSWGGNVATLGASGARGVRHLIYIAAVLTEAGHPALAPSAVPPGRVTMRSKVVTETATATEIDREASLEVFYPDVDPELARQAAARLRPFQKAGYQVVGTDAVAAWRTIPTTYAVCTEDRMIHPDTQREMAAAAGAEVVEWKSGHSPFLSRPGLVADLVARRAGAPPG
jgi:pimeloyl-ACP methyl ester carboxylesterase